MAFKRHTSFAFLTVNQTLFILRQTLNRIGFLSIEGLYINAMPVPDYPTAALSTCFADGSHKQARESSVPTASSG